MGGNELSGRVLVYEVVGSSGIGCLKPFDSLSGGPLRVGWRLVLEVQVTTRNRLVDSPRVLRSCWGHTPAVSDDLKRRNCFCLRSVKCAELRMAVIAVQLLVLHCFGISITFPRGVCRCVMGYD